MNWYLLVKFLHIIAVTITIGGMFARQLVRGFAKRSEEINAVASLTQVAVRIDRTLVIPWSNIMILMGILLAIMQKGRCSVFCRALLKTGCWYLTSCWSSC